jgi:hypothetical protein
MTGAVYAALITIPGSEGSLSLWLQLARGVTDPPHRDFGAGRREPVIRERLRPSAPQSVSGAASKGQPNPFIFVGPYHPNRSVLCPLPTSPASVASRLDDLPASGRIAHRSNVPFVAQEEPGGRLPRSGWLTPSSRNALVTAHDLAVGEDQIWRRRRRRGWRFHPTATHEEQQGESAQNACDGHVWLDTGHGKPPSSQSPARAAPGRGFWGWWWRG